MPDRNPRDGSARGGYQARGFDVVIVGGGVAGCATALSLKQHDPELSVVIVERGAYDAERIGETLPPHATVLFRQLGLTARLAEQGYLPAHGTSAVWGDPELHHNEFLFTPYGHGWHLDRRAFDRWLASEAEDRGAVLLTGTRLLDHRRDDEGWALTVRNSSAEHQLRGRFLVDATGRQAVVAHQQGARNLVLDRLVGIYRFVEPGEIPETGALVEAVSDGWWYSALIPDGRLVIALMTDADIARQHELREPEGWNAWLDRTEYTRRRLRAGAAGSTPIVTAAHSQRLDLPCAPGWLAVGDAASTFDPLSSLGIFKALRTGIFASYAILDHFKGEHRGIEKYGIAVDAAYRSYLDKRLEHYRQERRWPEAPFWRRRHVGRAH